MTIDVREIGLQDGAAGERVPSDRLGRDNPAVAGATSAATEFARSTGVLPASSYALGDLVSALRDGDPIALAAPALVPRLRPPNGYVTLEGQPSLRVPVPGESVAPFDDARSIAPQAFSRPLIEVPQAAEDTLTRMVAARGPGSADVLPTADLVQRNGRVVGQPGVRVAGQDYMMFLSIAGNESDAIVTANVLTPGASAPVSLFDGQALSRGGVRVELTPNVRDAIATLLDAAASPGLGSPRLTGGHAELIAAGGIRG